MALGRRDGKSEPESREGTLKAETGCRRLGRRGEAARRAGGYFLWTG